MKSQLLLSIKDAEAEAARRVAQAESEAKGVVADARRQAEALIADATAQADFAHQERVATARTAADGDATKTVKAGADTATALKKRFHTGLAGAPGRVLNHFEERL